jgi:Phosphoribosyl-ATP pyrophosphohydrolase
MRPCSDINFINWFLAVCALKYDFVVESSVKTSKFYKKYDEIAKSVKIPKHARAAALESLACEELDELITAHDNNDLEECLDGAADLLYVLAQSSESPAAIIGFGWEIESSDVCMSDISRLKAVIFEAFKEVCKTNDAKIGGGEPSFVYDKAAGVLKIGKPEGWAPPDHTKSIELFNRIF